MSIHGVESISVIAVEDAAGPFFEPRSRAFPTATPEQWAAADALDPAARTPGGEWLLRFRSYAVRVGTGPVILVDAGIGPAGSLAADWAPVPGRLPDALAEAGIAPGEVSAIVLTHLHNDHMGWAVPRDSPFTEARVVMQQADIDAYAANREQAGQYDLLVEPLRAAGRLEAIAGERVLADGVRVVPTPGHTPGHQSVWVESGGDSLLITGDLLVHAIQLTNPELPYASDMNPDEAGRSRITALSEARRRGATVAVSHLGEAFRALAIS
ncbi:MBL fold metallo-hydrolase [Paractinoplanes lichenicola]|nr:MBL fold metallo-hydrolase [Actinoplanes lichenicola]